MYARLSGALQSFGRLFSANAPTTESVLPAGSSPATSPIHEPVFKSTIERVSASIDAPEPSLAVPKTQPLVVQETTSWVVPAG